MADALYLEDLAVGRRFETAARTVTADEIVAFARAYDPQPFHVDPEAARASVFQGLAASGWHTAALVMRLLVDSPFKPAGGIVGIGVDELRWPRPLRPGDSLRVVAEVVENRRSRSKPEQGVVRVRNTALDQSGEPVMSFVAMLVVPARSAGEP